MDITQLILDDHHEQRRLFAILEQIDRADTGVLSAIWSRLATFLELHAAAEEEIFYPVLLQVGLAGRRTTTRSGMPSPRSPAIRSVPTPGSPRSRRPTWPIAITWARRSAKA